MTGAAQQVAVMLGRPYARFFGFEAVSVESGAVTLALGYRPELGHAPGWFEGCLTTAVGSMSASYSAITASQAGWTHLTLEQSIHFLGAAQGERLIGVGRTIRPGRTISYSGSDIFVERDGDRQLCARLTLTMRHVAPRGEARA